ncbi:hypothetical protein [Marinigracilibium pacificum]|uniref:Uncharacterized protein n=1 Tax=Marinigracilibium pacificum TaxID=2729599 RepID=A0A848J6I6_9BACT|nr:hypothetical protein [Marinigracilibium pacificum]NMM50858.1 hypothetical protein [Marinigracilibium pacificum]
MKIKKLILTSFVIVLCLISCGTNIKTDNTPNLKLASDYNIDSNQLVYQYYQKFGFTDVCEDIRMVAKLNKSPNFKKRLPITDNDLNTINSFSNKIDSINNSQISFESNTRNHFYDIELDFVEFNTDSLLTIDLSNGEYEIIQTDLTSTLKVFDKQSGLIYVESHRCD